MTKCGDIVMAPQIHGSPFWTAFVVGLSSPSLLYSAPVSYMSVVRNVSPDYSFGMVGSLITYTMRKARSDETITKTFHASAQ